MSNKIILLLLKLFYSLYNMPTTFFTSPGASSNSSYLYSIVKATYIHTKVTRVTTETE